MAGSPDTADVLVPTESRAVLIGVSAYEYAEFPPIRAARNSLQALRSVLSDPALCGWDAGQITVIANPISAAALATTIADLAEAATGVLLLYYVGHGVLSPRGELCLTVTSTRPDRPKISGLPWDTVADVLRGCPARTRLAILDCCFAGQAIEALTGGGEPGLADIAHVEGVYTLTATTGNRAAHVPPPGQQETACTSFTGELRDLVRAGIPGKPARLAFGDIYPVLRQRLRGKGLPAPGQRDADAAAEFAFTANAAVRPDQPPASAATAPSAPDASTPGPPPAAAAGPGRDPADLAKHTSLVASALRATHSVGDEAAKAQALAAIADALAVTDPARASRLAVDAYRVAQSITGRRARALAIAAVAGPLAAADPDQAEQSADQAEQSAGPATVAPAAAEATAAGAAGDGPERAAQGAGGESAKAQTLAAVAGALAHTDPGRAARLIAEAERLAGSVQDRGDRARATAAVAEGLAVIDSDRAERAARSVSDATLTTRALVTLAHAVSADDPDRAARVIADAERLTQSISGATARAPALAAVAGFLAATDPGRAARLTAAAEHLAQSIPDPKRRAAALAAVAGGLAAADPEHAERLAQSITTASFRATALAAVAKALAT